MSSENSQSAGPFVQAYLKVSPHFALASSSRRVPTRSATELIRDSDESEKRLFKFIGEDKGANGGASSGSGLKRVEKREGGVVTPLKDLRKARHGDGDSRGAEDVEIMLMTAGKLVDD